MANQRANQSNYQTYPNSSTSLMATYSRNFNNPQSSVYARNALQGQKYQLPQNQRPVINSVPQRNDARPISNNNFQKLHAESLQIERNSNTQTKPIAIPPQRRVEYVPYEQRYVEYTQQRVKVPVQKQKTDYYRIEHVIDYIPIEKEDIVYVTQAKETVNMKLQYVPVQQRIVHVKEEDIKFIQIKEPNFQRQYKHYQHLPVTFQQAGKVNATPMNQESQVYVKKSKTNFVTCEDYDPNRTLKQIDRVLASSSVHGNAPKNISYDQNANFYGEQIMGSIADFFKQPNELKNDANQSGIQILNEVASGISKDFFKQPNELKNDANQSGIQILNKVAGGISKRSNNIYGEKSQVQIF